MDGDVKKNCCFRAAQAKQTISDTSQYSWPVFCHLAVDLGLNFALKQTLKVSKCSLQSQKGSSQEAAKRRFRLPTGSASLLDETK